MGKSAKSVVVSLIGGTGFPIVLKLLEDSVRSANLRLLVAWLITAGITLVAYLILYRHFPRWDD